MIKNASPLVPVVLPMNGPAKVKHVREFRLRFEFETPMAANAIVQLLLKWANGNRRLPKGSVNIEVIEE